MCFCVFDLVFFAKIGQVRFELDKTEARELGAGAWVIVRAYLGVYDDIIWSGSPHTQTVLVRKIDFMGFHRAIWPKSHFRGPGR